MREKLGQLLLTLAEKILGYSACRIYNRKPYPGFATDGKKGRSPFYHENKINEFEHFFMLHNRYPYKGFSEHYLIVPNREIEGINELDDAEKLELINLIGTYENQGYIILSQQFGKTPTSSMSHKHVHILK